MRIPYLILPPIIEVGKERFQGLLLGKFEFRRTYESDLLLRDSFTSSWVFDKKTRSPIYPWTEGVLSENPAQKLKGILEDILGKRIIIRHIPSEEYKYYVRFYVGNISIGAVMKYKDKDKYYFDISPKIFLIKLGDYVRCPILRKMLGEDYLEEEY